MTKYVYSFGRGKAEGSSVMRNLLGGKGCELAEMTNLGIPVPPGFTITTQAWAALQPRRAASGRKGCGSRSLENLEQLEQDAGARARRRAAAAAGVGPLRRPRVDARHDGDRPQPGPQRRDRRWAGGAGRATSGSRGTATGASSRCSATWCSASSARRSTRSSTRSRSRLGVAQRSRGAGRRAAQARRRPSRTSSARAPGRPFPQDPREQLRLAINAVFDSWFAKKAIEYRRINTIPADWGTAVTVMSMVFGNLGDDIRHRGRLHARSAYRRAALLRRVPGQRPGRGRGGRHPDARAHRRAAAPHAGDLRRAPRDRRPPRASLQGHAGHRVHDPGGQALPPADPRRASARRAAAVRVAVDLVQESVIDQHTALLRVRPRDLDEAATCRSSTAVSDKARRHGRTPAGPRAARRAGRGRGRGRVRRRPRGGVGQGGPSGHPACVRRRRPRTSPACTPPRAS